MTWMNRYEVDEAFERYQNHPILGPATRTLDNLVSWTDRSSDGWPYWPKPARAAAKLMELIQGDDPSARYDDERADVTVEAYRAALRPIKAFRTRQGADFEVEEYGQPRQDLPQPTAPSEDARERVLTLADLHALSEISEACIHGYKVARLMPGGDVVEGTARSIGDEEGNLSPRGMDVRDMHMRVTTTGGFEAFWRVDEVMPLVHTGEFIVRR